MKAATNVKVTRLTSREWRVFKSVRLAALADAPSAFGTTLADAKGWTDKDWQEKLSARAQFVVDVQGIPVGTAAGIDSDEDPHAAELISMWVGPASRGHGIGDLLVAAVLGWARERGHQRVQLWVSTGNHAAERLYARHGFARTGTERAMSREDARRREFSMVRTLS